MTSAVEFALAAPLMCLMLGGIVDLGIAAHEHQRLALITSAGQQAGESNTHNTGCITGDGSSCPNWSLAVQTAMVNAAPDFPATVTVGPEVCGCPNADGTVTDAGGLPACYPNSTSLCDTGSPPGYFVTLTATFHHSPAVPLSILGETDLTSNAAARIQ